MTRGTVRDIRTRRRWYETADMAATFRAEMQRLVDVGEEFYVMHGICQHRDVRAMLDLFKAMNPDVTVLCERWIKPDVVLLIGGQPDA